MAASGPIRYAAVDRTNDYKFRHADRVRDHIPTTREGNFGRCHVLPRKLFGQLAGLFGVGPDGR